MSKEEVVEYLFNVGLHNVSINESLMPENMNPTQGLDSLLEAVTYVATNNIQKKSDELFDSIHLSTGTRTNYAQEVLSYVIKHQAKEALFMDAVEFFTESLS
jgi:hypothetical protein